MEYEFNMMNTNTKETLIPYTVYSITVIRTAGPKKGQIEHMMSRTDGNGKFESLRGYKFVAVRN